MSAYRRPWALGADPLSFSCRVCGVGAGEACEPLRPTGHATILRPHWQRGLTDEQVRYGEAKRRSDRAAARGAS